MGIKQRLQKVEKMVSEQHEGTLRVIFQDPNEAEHESIPEGNPKDTVVIFRIPRPRKDV
jgi:hypothetical protein